MKDPEKYFYQENYKKAAELVQPLAKKKGKDQLLYMMECGYIYHAAGDFPGSNKILLPASDLAKVVPVSISKQAASLFTNETVTNYRGEDFEKVLVHMYLGINFLMMNYHDEARVEFKAVNNELAKIKSENGEARYKQNIMAKYLTAVAYEISGEIDNDPEDLEFAYIEYQQILKLKPDYEPVKRDLVRLAAKLDYQDDYSQWLKQFSLKDNYDPESGEVILIYQSGRCAIKKSRGKLLEDRAMKTALVATLATGNLAAGVTVGGVMATLGNVQNPIPRFVRRPGKIEQCVIRIGNTSCKTQTLEDISTTAINNMDDMYPLLAGKVAASIAVKAAASVAAGIAAKKITEGAGGKSSLGTILGILAGVGTGAALFSQVKPDLRCWHTLPDKLQLARMRLKPGTYKAVLEFKDASGTLIKEKNIELTVEKGKKVFINERTLI